jgi:hypothetical protein
MRLAGFSRHALGAVTGLVALLFTLGLAPQPSPVRILAESIPGAVSPEVAADLLIRVGDSAAAGKEPAEWRADLYDQAFQLARSAPDPLPRYPRRDPRARSRVNPIGPDGRLDALSLQVRAFNGLLELRRERALELAGTIELRIPALACSDSTVPAPGGAFDVARYAHDLLERHVQSVHSSTQLAPAFEAILAAELSAADSRALLTTVVSTMRLLDDDDVSFTDTLGPTWAAVKHVVDSSDDGSFGGFVLDAFRSYIVRHLSGERCPAPSPPVPGPSAETDTLAEIDQTLSTHDRPVLSARERTASRQVEVSKGANARERVLVFGAGLWQTAASKNLIEQVMALRAHRQSGRPVNDPRTPEWNERLSRIYARMGTWTRSDEPSVEHYMHERIILLEMLVDVIPSGADRLRALGDVLAFLKSDGRQIFDSNVWADRLRTMIGTCRNSPIEWEWLMRALLDSGDPVMRLYAQLEQLSGA